MLLPILRRLTEMLFVMFGISIVVFLIFFATPGADPSARIAGRNATPEVLAQVRHSFGFDQPLPVQYGKVMEKLFISRDLTSFVNRGERVIPAVVEATPVTLSLVFGAAVIWVIFGGIIMGMVAAATRGGIPDRAADVPGTGRRFRCRSSGSARSPTSSHSRASTIPGCSTGCRAWATRR
jgi:peptide/nickel transport system permease protein